MKCRNCCVGNVEWRAVDYIGGRGGGEAEAWL